MGIRPLSAATDFKEALHWLMTEALDAGLEMDQISKLLREEETKFERDCTHAASNT